MSCIPTSCAYTRGKECEEEAYMRHICAGGDRDGARSTMVGGRDRPICSHQSMLASTSSGIYLQKTPCPGCRYLHLGADRDQLPGLRRLCVRYVCVVCVFVCVCVCVCMFGRSGRCAPVGTNFATLVYTLMNAMEDFRLTFLGGWMCVKRTCVITQNVPSASRLT